MEHLHIETESRDCDGRIDREAVSTQSIYEWLGFAAMPSCVGAGEENEATVRMSVNGNSRTVTVAYPTEEGYHRATAVECDDTACDLDTRSQRDYAAEAMGY